MLSSQIGTRLHCIIESIGEVGGANRQGQFHNLPFVKVFAQFFEGAFTQGRGAARDAFCV